MGKHVATRAGVNRTTGAHRLTGIAAAAGLALALVGAPVAYAHGSGADPGGRGGAASAPAVSGAAALSGDAIARLAVAQVGLGPYATNSLGGRGFGSSVALPDAWCAAFAAWDWGFAGSAGGAVPVSTAGLDGWAGSFLTYGRVHGSYHARGPRVGDAVLSAFAEPVAQASAAGTLADTHLIAHVGIVVAVDGASMTVVNGDWGDGRGGPRLVRVSQVALSDADAGDWAPAMEQYIAGYVDPVAAR